MFVQSPRVSLSSDSDARKRKRGLARFAGHFTRCLEPAIHDPHVGNPTHLRKLRHLITTQLNGSSHLQLRMHVLRELCGYRARERVPELWRRLRAAADSPRNELAEW